MATITVNGVRLFYTLAGEVGPPLVLVHGSWADHHDWDAVAPALSQRFRVLTYDRRGHGQSERPPGPGSLDEDAADLALLIEQSGLAPAHVAGHSLGGSIALRLAAQYPQLVASVTVHEPPLFGLLAGDAEREPAMREVLARIEEVAARLEAGDTAGGTRHFMETVVFGPGAWDHFPDEVQQLVIANAPTFLDEARDPNTIVLDTAAMAAYAGPILLTCGDQSPPVFAAVVAKLAEALPQAEVRVIAGAGHLPLDSHPADCVAVVTDFVAAAAAQPV
jgi:pimeloyl-ACP methyl ester carboxylesterase